MSAGRPLRRVLLVGDIAGAADFHVGDEAMLEANLLMLRRLLPAAEFTLVSLDPPASAARYACAAVPRLGLSGAAEQRAGELQRMAHWLQAARDGQPLPPALAALAQADLLVISGGGNLSSTWPEHILERLALARLARERGIPLLVFGQTLGPNLTPEDAQWVAELLRTACWVGVREASSLALALRLGVAPANLDYQVDDAADLPGQPLADPWPATGSGPRLALTLHPVFEAHDDNGWLDRLAGELQRLIDHCGARLLFVPHLRCERDGRDGGDRAVGEALARRLRDAAALRVLDVPGSAEAVWLAQQADIVLSSRYHPLVFGLARGVPCLGLATDRYTRTKLRGALAHAGRETDLLDLWDNGWPGLAERLDELCRRPAPSVATRQAEAQRLAALRRSRETRLMQCLAQWPAARPAAAIDEAALLALASLLGEAPAAEQTHALDYWRSTAEQAQDYALSLERALAERDRQRQTAADYAASLERARAEESVGVEALRAELQRVLQRAEAAEAQLRARKGSKGNRA